MSVQRRHCPTCGARRASETHTCDPAQVVDHEVLRLRDEIDRFEHDFGKYLSSGAGTIAQWLAERTRPALES